MGVHRPVLGAPLVGMYCVCISMNRIIITFIIKTTVYFISLKIEIIAAGAHRAGIVVVTLARWSTSSARAGNTVGATHAPVPSLKSRGQGRPSATAVPVAPVLRALLLNHQPRQQQH